MRSRHSRERARGGYSLADISDARAMELFSTGDATVFRRSGEVTKEILRGNDPVTRRAVACLPRRNTDGSETDAGRYREAAFVTLRRRKDAEALSHHRRREGDWGRNPFPPDQRHPRILRAQRH